MVSRLLIAGAVPALMPRGGGANADLQPKPMLVPPISPACISSSLVRACLRTAPAHRRARQWW